MRAVIIKRYGGPYALELADQPRPEPKDHQLLIRVHAAAVNPIDWRIRSGSLRFLWPLKLPLVLGYDVAGVVEEVGRHVQRFQPGDEVYAYLDQRRAGGYAQYAVAGERCVALKPANLSPEEAAAVPLAGLTSLQSLRDLGHIRNGDRVLINGASGGVGTFAVQLAKLFGADAVGVCGTANMDLVRKLGADRVLDYTRDDFTLVERRLDIVLDAVAKSHFRQCRHLLRPGGVFITTVPDAGALWNRLATLAGEKQCRSLLTQPRGDDLDRFRTWIEQDKVHPVIDRVLPLEDAVEAHRLSEQGHARGKIVLKV
jgi:NADPH:quinone reductase-like Zn-dependent oxidoreductase